MTNFLVAVQICKSNYIDTVLSRRRSSLHCSLGSNESMPCWSIARGEQSWTGSISIHLPYLPPLLSEEVLQNWVMFSQAANDIGCHSVYFHPGSAEPEALTHSRLQTSTMRTCATDPNASLTHLNSMERKRTCIFTSTKTCQTWKALDLWVASHKRMPSCSDKIWRARPHWCPATQAAKWLPKLMTWACHIVVTNTAGKLLGMRGWSLTVKFDIPFHPSMFLSVSLPGYRMWPMTNKKFINTYQYILDVGCACTCFFAAAEINTFLSTPSSCMRKCTWRAADQALPFLGNTIWVTKKSCKIMRLGWNEKQKSIPK